MRAEGGIVNRPNILYLMSDEHSYRCMGHVPEGEGGEPVDTIKSGRFFLASASAAKKPK